jgi:1-acyl-sn-glycerol-3-phosphate acyltransferase
MIKLKNIFARIWALWGLISFLSTFVIVLIPAMFSYLFADEKKGQIFYIKISRLWMRFWLFLIGCPLKISGLSHFKKDEAFIVVFNHNTMLDIPLSCPFVPGANKTIAKSSFAKIPLFGWFYRKGAVLVDRKSEKSRRQSFELMKKVLLTEMHMCIYPEGTRNRTSLPLKTFYDGAFRLSKETGKRIIPCILKGPKEAMPIHKPFYLFPTKLSMTFLPPISPDGLSVKELNEKTYRLMLHELEDNNVNP